MIQNILGAMLGNKWSVLLFCYVSFYYEDNADEAYNRVSTLNRSSEL